MLTCPQIEETRR